MKDIIDYTKLDPEIVELVYLFNKIGLRTKYSCIGHDDSENPMIMLHESVSKDLIDIFCRSIFIKAYKFNYYPQFKLWIRPGDPSIRRNINDNFEIEIWENWVFSISMGGTITRDDRVREINNISNLIKEIYQIK